MSLWELLDEPKEENKENEAAKSEKKEKAEAKEEKRNVEAGTEPVKNEPEKEPKKPAEKKEAKKKSKAAKTGNKAKGYVYPFGLYTEGHEVDITNYGFEDGKGYSADEITRIMLAHKHYEFSGEMEYSMITEDNILVANAKQHKKG